MLPFQAPETTTRKPTNAACAVAFIALSFVVDESQSESGGVSSGESTMLQTNSQ
jgi:hypothetical protein